MAPAGSSVAERDDNLSGRASEPFCWRTMRSLGRRSLRGRLARNCQIGPPLPSNRSERPLWGRFALCAQHGRDVGGGSPPVS